jgi:hypothetical protein
MTEMLKPELVKEFMEAPWLTHPGLPPLYGASVQSGETMERIVLDSLRVWFSSRRNKDFMAKGGKTEECPRNIQRWAAHFFLSTNINIAASPSKARVGSAPNNDNIIPSDHFFNYEMLRGYSDLLVSCFYSLLFFPKLANTYHSPAEIYMTRRG